MPLHRRHALALLLAGLALPAEAGEAPAQAGVIQLTAAQIDELLRGNTITGTWSGSAYTQYFAESGMTVYLPEGGRPDQGRWRTNAETDRYESWWRMSDWSGYRVMMTNDGYAWVNGEALEPFTVQAGKQVVW